MKIPKDRITIPELKCAMDTITIEVRPRLRCCNVFISTQKTLEPNSIQLKLGESVITLRVGKLVKFLNLTTIKIQPKTLSCLVVTDNWISFRVSTQPLLSTFGSFKTELVGMSNEPNKSMSSTNQIEATLKQKKCILRCSRCKDQISKALFFERVLPLPTSDCDPGEWFCCKHDSNDYSKLTSPRESDCFYESHYRLLNKITLGKQLKMDNKIVACNRCMSALGTYRATDDFVKIWNCCVEYVTMDGSSVIENVSNPLKDFAQIISNKTDIFTDNKILLEAQDKNVIHYLTLQVMEQNLELLMERESSQFHGRDRIELTSVKVIKLLYKYSEIEAEATSDCVEIERCQVALPVMLAAVNHLSATTKRLPPSYRTTMNNQFVGWIHM